MLVEKVTKYGSINIMPDAIATLVGGVVTESYGVVGMASRNLLKDGLYELLNKDNFSKGVSVKVQPEGLQIDIYIIVSLGIKISEVILEVQKNVKYTLEKTLQQEILTINVYVQGVKAA